ncbi:enoyl-CoA hydratase/isomerase family protein [Rhodococcus sp. BP-332]|uniref:enoyl-CoA hydratase/isomerase family protein n=1 Tax=Rhodococcus sp. BP-332 TaxID=2739447 RepID=UPI001C9B7CD5|nr:enoyl-CoA hydratase/isomerase family protein [Rhodococcus sp. BP-332]MBY6679350.1 enoyl-CoA hydratase/isomerase family protein [Rhodococcus sp. BP-332]
MSDTAAENSDVLLTVDRGVATVTLNRPRAINALSHAMVRDIDAALVRWEDDPSVRAVLITGNGERGLCAGGDIVAIHDDAKAKAGENWPTGSATAQFWRDEYVMNSRINRYGKPIVALMDGAVMGGGVGISAHATVRIVTEKSKVAMPEVGIGFVPDVGGTYLLARTPGEIGTHLALTTARMTAGDAVAAGFADHFVPTEDLPAFVEALHTGTVDTALSLVSPVPESALAAQREWIDAAYTGDDAASIVARLRADGRDEAVAAADAIEAKSPTSVAVTLRSLRRASAASSLDEVLDDEYRVSIACLDSPDLVEGIRAQVVDKDRRPRWRPAHLDDVTTSDVDRFFAPLGDAELGLTSAAADSVSKGPQS